MKPEESYWQNKIKVFIHDTPDKVLDIRTHESRAKVIADSLGGDIASKDEVSLADQIAAGLDRANLPGYDKNHDRSGAVNFQENPCLTHSISGGKPLHLNLPGDLNAHSVSERIAELIRKDTEDTAQQWDKEQYFNYLFFLLRKRLTVEDTAGLGFLWDRLPADSRIPDHSAWNHCGIVSAVRSCMDTGSDSKASLVVFSMSPVQSFITKARKLRDHWSASVLLSWLVFEGISSVIENLGPDHILYPSLQDQPLVEAYLNQKYNWAEHFNDYDRKAGLEKDEKVASFPNKFVFLAPSGSHEKYVKMIKEQILSKWKELSNTVKKWLVSKGAKDEDGKLQEIFDRQTENYWNFTWSACNLVKTDNQADINKLFSEEKFKKDFDTVEHFSRRWTNSNVIYSATHSTAQTLLAATKSRPQAVRNPEPGKKCPVCGELEVLHDFAETGQTSANDYKTATENFWESIDVSKYELKNQEQLCAVCSIKRFAPKAVVDSNSELLLHTVFEADTEFPSTTTMAAGRYCEDLIEKGILDRSRKRQFLDELHDSATEEDCKSEIRKIINKSSKKGIRFKDTDKYYCILVMDGDKMGDLVNGENIASKWRDVIHPDLVPRLTEGTLAEEYKWNLYLDSKRILSPAVHNAISESLGVFSTRIVPAIVKKHKGHLIYAGGDDVCAVLPLSTALKAADDIRLAYNMRFAKISGNGATELDSEVDTQSPIIVLPGSGNNISISAALHICHHKQPLRGALESAQHLLKEKAKKQAGRNAVAICLDKRSGHQRNMAFNWNDKSPFTQEESRTRLQAFLDVAEAVTEKQLSTSMLYRLAGLEQMILSAMGEYQEIPSDNKIDMVRKILKYEIKHSGAFQKDSNADRLSENLAAITIFHAFNKKLNTHYWKYDSSAAEIACYLSKGGESI